jgi:hypothetical protein
MPEAPKRKKARQVGEDREGEGAGTPEAAVPASRSAAGSAPTGSTGMPELSKRRKTKHVEAAGDGGAVGSETIDNAEVTGAAIPVSSAEHQPKTGKKRGGSGTPAENVQAAAEVVGEGEKEEELSAKRGRGSQPRSQRDPSVSDSVELITEDTIEQLRKENAKLKEENKALREVSSRLLRQQAKTNVMLADAFQEQKRFVIKLASDTRQGFETLRAELSSLRPVEQTVDEGDSKEKESKAAKKDESGAEACGEGIGESEKASSETGAGADKEQQGGSEGTEGGHDETNRQRDVPMFRGGARARGTPPARMFGGVDDYEYGGNVGERYEGPRGVREDYREWEWERPPPMYGGVGESGGGRGRGGFGYNHSEGDYERAGAWPQRSGNFRDPRYNWGARGDWGEGTGSSEGRGGWGSRADGAGRGGGRY